MEEASPIAIRTQGLGKCYRILPSPRARLLQGLWPGQRQFFKPFWALQDLSFSLEAGQTLGIVGCNGSGKSTLLQLLCGTLTPTTGTVQCKGRVAALLELGSGFNPEFTGLENIQLNATLLGLSQEEIDQCLDKILAFADIGSFVDQPVKTYSSGMALRLAFAVQAMIYPDVLIVDEALAVGDELFQRKCFKHLETLKSNGTSILLVSHNCAQIVQHCDQALLLHQGKMACMGQPKLITTVYQRLLNTQSDTWSQEANELFQALERAQEQDRSKEAEALQQGFDPALQPETTTSYPSCGLRIESVLTLDSQGHQINVIYQGDEFKIRISYFADQSLDHLELACNLASHSGQVIAGQRFPELGQGLASIQANQSFSCTFSFRGNLSPGVYFISAGAWNTPERKYLHRIVDACAIRILPSLQTTYSFGLVDLGTGKPELTRLAE